MLGRPSEETDWLSSLPALTDELKQMALKAWRKTRQPERRRELTRRLSSGKRPRPHPQNTAGVDRRPAGDGRGRRR